MKPIPKTFFLSWLFLGLVSILLWPEESFAQRFGVPTVLVESGTILGAPPGAQLVQIMPRTKFLCNRKFTINLRSSTNTDGAISIQKESGVWEPPWTVVRVIIPLYIPCGSSATVHIKNSGYWRYSGGDTGAYLYARAGFGDTNATGFFKGDTLVSSFDVWGVEHEQVRNAVGKTYDSTEGVFYDIYKFTPGSELTIPLDKDFVVRDVDSLYMTLFLSTPVQTDRVVGSWKTYSDAVWVTEVEIKK